MKRLISMGIISGFALLLCSEIVVAQQKTVPPPPPPPPPAPKVNKTEKHVKMVKIDENGKKVELDTILTSNAPFVWMGDTIGGKDKFKVVEGFKIDTSHYFDYKIDRESGNVMIMEPGKGKHVFAVPGVPMPPHAPGMMMFKGKRNVIDLSDPGIISYNKKIQKDGTEKITIVRKQVPESKENEDVMIHAPMGGNAFYYNNGPGHTKTVKVIKSDDGTTKVIEDDEIINIESGDGESKITSEDGNVIIVKGHKKGDQKEVEVKVEQKAEKK